ncbi:hypothetical protein [Pseudothermotoga thermarum]|uniref:DUF3352 domain-containing protein n=1 Tax=Pseudothermotoga thermarum DSM 5069 TaxID=688269 RepID=F7YYT5_9THEM|nr:hypothetical protein [Pseudothermotoga thermarum]AEH51123.1 hypothetical protein Theth_1043 [Pseudothermotoga thermarum DSM 5069]
MKKAFLLLILLVTFIGLASDIVKFVPKDYDFFLLFKDNEKNFAKLSSVPFFNFLLKEDGLGVEKIVESLLENIKYSHGVSPKVFYEAFSKEVLYASKGTKIDLSSIFSLDPNYYIEVFKNIGVNSIVVLQTDKPNELIRLFAAVMNLKLSSNEGTWILIDSDVAIFARYIEGYLVFAGSKGALEKAIDVYDRPNDQLLNEFEQIKDLLSLDSWFCGFFKSDSFSFNTANLSLENTAMEYTTVKGEITSDSLRVTVGQYLTNLEVFRRNVSGVSTMLGMPFIGNYAFSATASGPLDIAKNISSWFEGAQEEVKKIYEIVSSILEVSTDRVYVTGNLYGEKILFAAIFQLRKEYDFSNLIKYGARNFGNEIRLPIFDGYIAFFTQGKNLIMTNMSKDEYEKLALRKKLRDEAAYQYLSKRFPSSDVMRIYVDLGDLFQSMLGLKAKGKLLFSGYVTKDAVVYTVEVM